MRARHPDCLLILAALLLSGCNLLTPSQSSEPPSELPSPTPSVITEDSDATPSGEPETPIWQPATDGSGLQHVGSGFICPAEQGEFLLTGEETFPGLGAGNDVACIFRAAEGGLVRLHLTYFGRDVSPSAHLKGVQTQIAETTEIIDEAPTPPLSGGITIENAAAYQIAAKSALRPDVPVHTAVWIAPVGTWHVKARATYEADRNTQIGQLISALFSAAQDTIGQTSPDNPP